MNELQGAMPRAPSENTTQIVLRVPEAWVQRADALLQWIARPGISATRTDAIRAAIARGLDALETEQRAETKPTKKRTK